MIKSFFRFSFLVLFVLVFRLNIYADENTPLLESISETQTEISGNVYEILSELLYSIDPYLWTISDIVNDHRNGFFYDFLPIIRDNISPAVLQISDYLESIEESNDDINTNLGLLQGDTISILSELLPFFSKFTFSEEDLNVYDQRVAGLIQELKEQDESLLGNYIEIGEYIREGVDNGVMKLGDIYNKLNSDTGSPDNYLTQSQLEESYEKFLIPNFYQSFLESKAIPFADYISWSDPTALDYKEDSSFDIKVQSPLENSDGNFFQVLSGYLSNLASLHANNSRSLVLMTKIMKGDDHKAEEDEIKNDINENLGRDQEIHQAMDELITILEDSYTTQSTSKFFDLSSLDGIASVSLPNEINLGSLPLSNIFGIDLTEFKNFYLDITFFHPMIEVSRSVFSIILFLFLGSIAIFIYRLSAPFIFRIIDLLKSAFANW